MNRREPIIFQTLGLLIAACGCIAAWLALPQIFPPLTTPPTDRIDPSQPTCQRQEVTLEQKTLPWFNPPLVRGDQGLDFNGNGPRIHVKVNLYVKDTNQVYANVFMAAQEILPNTDLGPLRAEGDTSRTSGGDFLVGEIVRPQDWQLTWEDSQNADIAFFDTDATLDIFPGDNSPLYVDLPHEFGPVAKFKIIGDTMHEDIGPRAGYHTSVQITLNPLHFLVEEKFNCTN